MTIVWSMLASAAVFAASTMVEVSEAPTSDLALTLRAISSARKTLKVNAYELTSPVIADAIRARINAGVQVDILQEGEPVAGYPDEGVPLRRALVAALRRAGKGSYREMVGRREGVRRFPYDHAKYMIVDSASVLIGSENYSPTGHPQPGAVGNRGWEVLIHDEGIASDFGKVFSGDRNKNHRDIEEWIGFPKALLKAFGMTSEVGEFFFTGLPQDESLKEAATAALAAGRALPASALLPVVSPDTSLSTLIGLIRAARRSIDVQQMIFNSEWDRVEAKSPLVAELLNAARRGIRVRVLLNDDSAFGGDPAKSKNAATIRLLDDLARRYQVSLQSRTADVDAIGVGYIHNKGALIDGVHTLISSINWNQNSIENNREAGVVVTSPEINRYYSALFDSDWRLSARRRR